MTKGTPLTADINILDTANWRFEYKYRLSLQQYFQVRNALRPYAEPDPFTVAVKGGKYLVRSLYYDSIFFTAFYEKADGNCDRIKLRIRTYSKFLEDLPTIRVEMKARKSAITEKYGAIISPDEYQGFLASKHWMDTSDPVLSEFERYVHLKTQEPTMLIEYLREGYTARMKEQIRITFDHHVRSMHAKSLFPESGIFREHHPGFVVLEIKCVKQQPYWLRKLVQEQGLCIIANSKYSQSIMVSLPEMVTPAWSA